jgi:membrane-bound serine protease (ClpP class)
MEPMQVMVIAGLLMVMAELLVGIQTGFDLVLGGSILIISGFAGMFVGGWQLGIGLAIILSIVYIAYGRGLVKSKLIITTTHTNIDKLIGQRGVVVRSITPDTAGLVRLMDEDWRATSDEVLYEKDRVMVVAVEGVSLRVKKIKNS